MEENNDNLVSDNDENNTEIADSDAISIRSNEENIEDSDDTAINNFPIRHYKDFIFEGSVENYDDEIEILSHDSSSSNPKNIWKLLLKFDEEYISVRLLRDSDNDNCIKFSCRFTFISDNNIRPYSISDQRIYFYNNERFYTDIFKIKRLHLEQNINFRKVTVTIFEKVIGNTDVIDESTDFFNKVSERYILDQGFYSFKIERSDIDKLKLNHQIKKEIKNTNYGYKWNIILGRYIDNERCGYLSLELENKDVENFVNDDDSICVQFVFSLYDDDNKLIGYQYYTPIPKKFNKDNRIFGFKKFVKMEDIERYIRNNYESENEGNSEKEDYKSNINIGVHIRIYNDCDSMSFTNLQKEDYEIYLRNLIDNNVSYEVKNGSFIEYPVPYMDNFLHKYEDSSEMKFDNYIMKFKLYQKFKNNKKYICIELNVEDRDSNINKKDNEDNKENKEDIKYKVVVSLQNYEEYNKDHPHLIKMKNLSEPITFSKFAEIDDVNPDIWFIKKQNKNNDDRYFINIKNDKFIFYFYVIIIKRRKTDFVVDSQFTVYEGEESKVERTDEIKIMEKLDHRWISGVVNRTKNIIFSEDYLNSNCITKKQHEERKLIHKQSRKSLKHSKSKKSLK